MEHERATKKRVYWCIKPTIAVLILMLTVPAISTPSAGQAPVNAGELLAAFSGGSATQYQPFFQFSEETRLVSVEIHAVGNHDTTARYSGREHAWYEVNNILRITSGQS